MAKVLVVGATIQCTHGGIAKINSSNNKLTVSNNAVITSGQEVGISFAPGAPTVIVPCPFATAAGSSPCTATTASSAGISTLLLVGGVGVLLDSATGQTVNANSPGIWSVVSTGQTLLSVAH